MSKQGLSARLYASNQTLIMVKTELPQGILAASKGGSGARPIKGVQSPKNKAAQLLSQMGGGVAVRLYGGIPPEGFSSGT
ncbi:hypothetical protein SAMN05444158_6006 [Bradyrhizobium canariense]|uniref:Uncharacterized protein n=1 Tax=Bradyrhizobium canariense TaxID=255045 RepID=A0A1H2AAH2_9BRAD|nr:hypothetical protein SAMN05444158_6006 [Bradyrhizobium canariense]